MEFIMVMALLKEHLWGNFAREETKGYVIIFLHPFCCLNLDFAIFLLCAGIFLICLFLFLGLLTAPTRNSPDRVCDTIQTFPEKSWKPPMVGFRIFGGPNFPSRPPEPFKISNLFWDIWTPDSRGPPKTQKPTTADQTPHSRPFD